MSSHDLRRKAQRLTDLRRRYKAHDALSDEEMAELHRGIPAEEMHDIIIPAIRGERRSAAPAKKLKTTKEKIAKEKAETTIPTIDIDSFLHEEHTTRTTPHDENYRE